MPLATNDPQPDTSSVLSGYGSASRTPPVPRANLATAYEPYGLTPGRVRGRSDAQLHRIAVDAVIKWYQTKRAAAARPAAPAPSRSTSTTGGSSRTAAPAAGGSARTVSSSSASRTLPNTAMSRTPTQVRAPVLAPIASRPVNTSAPQTNRDGVLIQRPPGRGFTRFGV